MTHSDVGEVKRDAVVLMGLFHESTEAADAIDEIHRRGLPDDAITVMSSIPYPEQAIGRHSEWLRLPYIVLVGAFAGLLIGLFLSVGTPRLYLLNVGGHPVSGGPPAIVITYVFTMMATIVSTFLGVIWEMGFPSFAKKYYHKLTTSGHLSVLLECPAGMEEELSEIMRSHGGHHIHRPEKEVL